MDAQGLEELTRKAEVGGAEAQLRFAAQLDKNGEGALALDWLRRAAASGHVPAKTALAKRLISRPPFSTEEGVSLALAAAKAGDGEAAYLLSSIAAAGLVVPQSWPAALGFLARAAELGVLSARAALVMLSSRPELVAHAKSSAPSPDIWRHLRDSVDLAVWLSVPQACIHSQSPRIAIVEGFASPAVCDWLIASARPRLEQAHTVNPSTGQPFDNGERTNSAAHFSIADIDMILLLMRARIATLSGLSTGGMDAPAILHYAVGQEFSPHFDFLDLSVPGHVAEMAAIGQRVLTFLVYLNDGFEGAETDFPAIGWRFKGKKGDAVFFWNVHPDGTPDPLTLHAGRAPTRGEKWLLSQWVRGRSGNRP
jgi:prolyl 4-hydroxylase